MKIVHPCGKRGIAIPGPVYYTIAALIAEQLAAGPPVTLKTLLHAAREKMSLAAKDHWLVYYVKLDLESLGYITVEPSGTMEQLKLTCKGHAALPFCQR